MPNIDVKIGYALIIFGIILVLMFPVWWFYDNVLTSQSPYVEFDRGAEYHLESNSDLIISGMLLESVEAKLVIKYDGTKNSDNDFKIVIKSPNNELKTEQIKLVGSHLGARYLFFVPDVRGNYTCVITNLTNDSIPLSVYFGRSSNNALSTPSPATFRDIDLSVLIVYSPYTYLGIVIVILGMLIVIRHKKLTPLWR